MPLKVVSCCTYPTACDTVWRSVDHDARNFVHAIKGRFFAGTIEFAWRGAARRIDHRSLDAALTMFAEMALAAGGAHGLTAPALLIPVPNSGCVLTCERPPRTSAQAEALSFLLGSGSSVADVLRWRAPLPSASSSSGTRDPQALFDNLRLINALPRGTDQLLVLVDDVLTTGGHLQACAAKLRRAGSRAALAVVAGRSDRDLVRDPFAPRVEELTDFTPSWFKLVCTAN